jgi:hypothetical protein
MNCEAHILPVAPGRSPDIFGISTPEIFVGKLVSQATEVGEDRDGRPSAHFRNRATTRVPR